MIVIVSSVHEDNLASIPGVGTYLWRVPEDVLEWSSGLMAIFGVDTPPTAELGFYALLHPEDRLRVEAETNAFLEQSSHYSHEFRIIRPDGTVRHIHDRAVVERAPGGQVIAIRGINIDITDDRSTIPDSGFAALADNINQLAWMADREGWIFWFNARWFEYTGTTLAQMEGWGWRSVHHPDHVDRVVSRIARCFRSGEDWEDTFPLRKADGSYRWFLSRARAVRGADGTIHTWFGTNTDITAQREADLRALELQRQFKWLADSMPQLVWTATADGQVLYYNKRVDEYWPARNAMSGQFEWRNIVHADDFDRTLAQWRSAVEHGREYACEHRLRIADGTYRWHLSRAIPQKDAESGRLLWFGTATDIEDLKRSERDRELLLQELNHRVKNTLALVQSIAAQSFRGEGSTTLALDQFRARLHALASTHDLLLRQDWKEVELSEIVVGTIAALGVKTERLDATGSSVSLSGRISVMMAMAIHELGTNAVKYGALSTDDGAVSVHWQTDVDDASRFQLVWKESGGPPVATPNRQGFGTRLLTQALATAIAGKTDLTYAPDGFECIISGRSVD